MELPSFDEIIDIDLSVEPPPEDPVERLINRSMRLLFEDRYEELCDLLRRNVPLLLAQRRTHQLGVLLGAASYRPEVTRVVFDTVLTIDQTCASYQDAGNRTPLHMAVMYLDRPDLVRTLVDAAPECVHLADIEGLRAIDILTQRILMKEERIRYLGRRKSAQDEQALQDNWDCVQSVINAHCLTFFMREQLPVIPGQPFLHVVLQAPDIPLAITERAIRRFNYELALADANGNLPLHCIAARLPPEDMDVLEEVLNAFPRAARVKNHAYQWPFHLAIQARRQFTTGLETLLNVFPDPIGDLDLSCNVFPVLFDELFQHERLSLVYELMKAHPELVCDS